MANLRTDSAFFSYAWLAVLLGGGVYGGSLLFGQAEVQLPAQELVVEVRIEGNRTIPQTKILPHIHTRAGRPLDLEIIEEDVRRLNRTGMFVTVETLSQRVAGGRVVVFRVLERPVLQEVKYVGNKRVKAKVLQKEAGLKAGDALDPFAVEEARSRIENFYRSRGFSKSRVTILEGNRPGDRQAVFLINEGRKQRVLWTSFVGNTIASDARLRTQIKSKPGIFWLFKGEVDRKEIDEDVNRITAYYRSLGFFRARVGRELDFNADQDWLTLTFVIDEGPRYQVRKVSFIGNTKFATEELDRSLKLKDGQYFNQTEMTRDVATIQDKYGSVGYVFAAVNADPRFLEQPGQLDLVYNIDEGDRYRVGRINVQIKGDYPHTKIAAVLDRISLKPGDIVDVRKLRASERRLRASGLFLVDPMRGSAPKIVFSPPELEDAETQFARPPQRGPEVRRQSPDPVSRGRWSTNYRPQDRLVDLALRGRWIDPHPPRQPEPYPRHQPEPRLVPPGGQPRPMVVRAQYTPEPGWQVPRFRPKLPWLGSQQSASVPGIGAPAAGYAPETQPATVYQPTPTHDATPAAGPSGAGTPSLSPADGSQLAPGPRLPFAGGAAGPTQLPANEGLFSEDSPFLGGPPAGEPTRLLPLGVIAEETQTGKLMFGVGINSDAGLVGSILVDERNFDWTRFPRSWEDVRNATAWRGAGQRFRLEAVPGTEVQRYVANFQAPYLLHTDVSLGLSGYYYDRRFLEWSEQHVGGRVSLGYQFTPDLTGSFAFRGAKINIHDPLIGGLPELDEVLGDSSLYGFRFQLAHDTRDSAFLATEGHLIEVGYEQVTGTYNYPRAEVDLQKYFLLHERPDGSGRHVLSLSGQFGWTGSDTPIYEHYYAGGLWSIRGFDFRGASPQKMGVLVGGHFQLLASAQYMFPITADDMLRAVVFCDTGTVEPTIGDWTDNYRVAPGFGLRITVPAMGPAPIALDFAFPIATQPGDREQVFSFFVGFNR